MNQATSPQRWQQVKAIFQDVVELKPPERAAFLTSACKGDQHLRAQIERMLAADDSADSFLESSPVHHLLEATQPVKMGQAIGSYRITDNLGVGGMGEVYVAQDLRLERNVAVKLLPAVYTLDESRVQRFVREAKAVSALNHPNIVTIHEVGQSDQTHFIVTELVAGKTLRLLLDERSLRLTETIDIAIQIASALSSAHEVGIVHRDIKPENVMVRPDGIVKVLDFGLAKLTERRGDDAIERQSEEPDTWLAASHSTTPGLVMGTARYMSPEQARGVSVDERSDIFSLGVVLYEMLAGQPPFQGETTTDVIIAVVEKDPCPLSQLVPDVPRVLEQLVVKALQKDRNARYQTSADMLADLKAFRRTLDDEESRELRRVSLPAPQDTASRFSFTAEYVTAQIKQHKRASVAALGIVIAAMAIVTWFFASNRTYALSEKDTVLLADFVNNTGEAVFDGALKQALAVQLEQTPFLNFFPEERVRETLKLMNRAPDERLTREVAREICVRQGLKAALVGTIAKFDRNYSITLEAVNAENGAAIARALVEAEGRDEVLQQLGKAADQLREKLGESLSSMQRFAAPMEQATTSSLDALKAVSLARDQFLKGQRLEAIALYKRAIEIDPNFAFPYSRLANAYDGVGQADLAREYAEKGYALRERTSEREKFYITSIYHDCVTGEIEQDIETLKVWANTYPRDVYPHNTLAMRYHCLGAFEESINEAREAMRLDPNYVFPYGNLAAGLMRLNRYNEAQTTLQQAREHKLDSMLYHLVLFRVGFAQDNQELINQQINWGKGRLDEVYSFAWQSLTASFGGRMRDADDFTQRAISLAEQRNLREAAASFLVDSAARQALVGNQELAQINLTKAQSLSSSVLTRGFRNVIVLPLGPLACALNGNLAQAQMWIEETNKRHPHNSLSQKVWIPVTRAAIELRQGRADRAIELLKSAEPYEPASSFWPTWLRGQAYLQAKRGPEAAAEFQKIIAHRGWEPTSMLWSLAHLGWARAAALNNDAPKARQLYEQFFQLWKDADADVPLLIEANKEFEKVR
ncbi:MAG: protein kinase [Blastocatellia bacterium]|nr:protein kinase [Blastocatellia bacterium]